MSNKRYVKLGSKALSFFDPVSRMILTVGEATVLTPEFRQSKRVVKALRSGHLEYVDRDELEKYTIVTGLEEETETPEAPVEPETTDTNWMDEFELEEKKLAKLKLSQLQELATYYGVDMEEEEIQNATKAELILALLDLEDEDE